MNDNKKEIRRIRLEDLDSSLQNILLKRITKDDPTWKRITEIINDLYKKTHNEKKNITITINQSDNQTIHVYVPKKIGGVDYTSTFTCLTGTAYEAEVIAASGYKAGLLNISRSGVFTRNKTINATSATKSNATVTITQSANQTIHVYTPKKSGGTDHTSTFTCPVGTTYEAEVIAENGYVAGALNVSGSGTINSDMSINANPAIGMATVTIVQSAHQTIHVYTPYKGGTDHTSTFTCSIGTRYEVEVIADKGYTAGTPNTNGGTVNSNITINATGATVANATVTIVQSPNQTIHVYTPQKAGGTDHTSTFTCQVGTTYEAEVIADRGYNPGTLNVSGRGVINSDITISVDYATFKDQIFIAKGSSPWYNDNWDDKSCVDSIDTSVPGQAIITCDGFVMSMSYMFGHCTDNLTSLDLSNFDTSRVYTMEGMFKNAYGHPKLTSINVSNFDTSNAIDMEFMFSNCSKLTTLDVSSFDTSNVYTMQGMFWDCRNLTTLDLSNFDTSNVKNMASMFDNCNNLTTLDISNFDTSNVTDMIWMFYKCYNLTTIKGVIDMKSCKHWDEMFNYSSRLRGAKIKNPPSGFDGAGLSSSQYTIVS